MEDDDGRNVKHAAHKQGRKNDQQSECSCRKPLTESIRIRRRIPPPSALARQVGRQGAPPLASLACRPVGCPRFRRRRRGHSRRPTPRWSVNGDVGSVAVGAFRDSLLYVGYSGADDGSGAGGLGFYLPATVSAFRSTGKQDGFADSRVIATNIQTVTLSSADTANDGAPFGFDFHGAFGGLSVKNPKLSYNEKLGGSQVLAGNLSVDNV
jgi:hypothetical protein